MHCFLTPYEMATVALLFLNLVAFGIYLSYQCRQVELMRQATETTRKQLEATDRAWLKPSVLAVAPLTWSPAGAHFEFQIGWLNIGHSVARHAGVSARLISPRERLDLNHETQEECRMAEIMPKQSVPLGPVLWPGEHGFVFGLPVDVPRADIHANPVWRHTKEWPGEYWEPYLVGAVAYQLLNSTEMHYTTFAYKICRRPPSHHPGTTLLEIGVDTTAEDLVLSAEPFEGNDAN
jgi:hypothetical protein